MFVHLANQFVAWGRKVDLVLLRNRGPYFAEVDSRINLVDLRSSSLVGTLSLARYLRRERPMALVSAMDAFNVMALIAGGLARVKTRIIGTCHVHLTAQAQHTGAFRARALRTIVARLYPSAAGLIAVSKGVANDLTAIIDSPRTRVFVVHNPVIVPDTSALEPPHPWFLGEAPVLISAGRLVPQKDYATLLRSFARVVAGRPAKLIILGEGPDRPALSHLVDSLGLQDDVLLAGFVANPFAYFSHARLFVLSSRYEGFGMVIAEALACGCPVVSTDCQSGPAEILDNGRFGTLVPIGDVDAMALAIESSLSSPVDREVLKRRAGCYAVALAARSYLGIIDGGMPGLECEGLP